MAICHWKVQVPVPPDVEALNVLLPPVQIVPPPDADIEGSATTVTVTVFEVAVLHPDPLQLLTTL